MVDCQSARCILGSEDGSRHGGSRFGEQVVPSGPNLTMGADFFLPPAPSSFASWQLFLAPWSCCSTFLAPSAPRWHRAWSLLKYSNSNQERGSLVMMSRKMKIFNAVRERRQLFNLIWSSTQNKIGSKKRRNWDFDEVATITRISKYFSGSTQCQIDPEKGHLNGTFISIISILYFLYVLGEAELQSF